MLLSSFSNCRFLHTALYFIPIPDLPSTIVYWCGCDLISRRYHLEWAGSERCQQLPLLITLENEKGTLILAIRKTELAGECQPGNMKRGWYLDMDRCTEATDSCQKPLPHPFVLASKPQVPELSALAPDTTTTENIHDPPPGHVDSEA